MESTTRRDDLEPARQRRAALHAAMTELEQAATAPLHRSTWTEGVRRGLVHLSGVLDEHIAETEGPDGFFVELQRAGAGRVDGRIDGLRADHAALRARTAELLDRTEHPVHPEALREDVIGVVTDLSRHRHRGADVLYEVYEQDIGTGD